MPIYDGSVPILLSYLRSLVTMQLYELQHAAGVTLLAVVCNKRSSLIEDMVPLSSSPKIVRSFVHGTASVTQNETAFGAVPSQISQAPRIMCRLVAIRPGNVYRYFGPRDVPYCATVSHAANWLYSSVCAPQQCDKEGHIGGATGCEGRPYK